MPAFELTKTVFQSLFGKPATVLYPAEKRAFYANTRGSIAIAVEKCTLCLLCDARCPTDAIEVSRDRKSWAIDRLKCIQCGCCVDVCPRKCLAMENAYSAPMTEKRIETFAVPFTPPPKKPAAATAGGT